MYEIEIKGYIPRSPNATGRKHWGRTMDERNFWEAAIAREMWYQYPNRGGEDIPVRWIEIEIRKPGKIKLRDEDNLKASVKHVLDAMVNLDLLEDDSPEWLETRGINESNGNKGYSTVIRFGDV